MKRNVILLSFMAFVINLGFGAAAPLIPFLLLSYEGLITELPEKIGKIPNAPEIAFQISTIMAAFMLTRAFLARYFGRLSDSIGRKKLIIVGLIFYSILAFLYTLAASWIHLLLIRAFQGVASAMVWPIAEAMIADSVRIDERGRYMGWYMTFSNVSFFIGPAIGVILYKFAAFYLGWGIPEVFIFPFYILFALAIFSIFISLFTKETVFPKRKKQRIRKPLADEISETPTIILPPHISRSIMVIYIMGFANGIAMGLVAPVTQLFVIQYITADPAALGALSTISGFIGFLINYPSGYISDLFGRRRVVILGQITLRISTFFLPFIRTFEQLLMIYSLRSAAFNIMSPAYRALQADLVPIKMRGKIFGTVQTLFNFGAATTPLGGLLYQLASKCQFNILGYIVPGVAISFWLSTMIGIFTTILFALYVHEPTKEEKELISEHSIS